MQEVLGDEDERLQRLTAQVNRLRSQNDKLNRVRIRHGMHSICSHSCCTLYYSTLASLLFFCR